VDPGRGRERPPVEALDLIHQNGRGDHPQHEQEERAVREDLELDDQHGGDDESERHEVVPGERRDHDQDAREQKGRWPTHRAGNR